MVSNSGAPIYGIFYCLHETQGLTGKSVINYKRHHVVALYLVYVAHSTCVAGVAPHVWLLLDAGICRRIQCQL